MKEQKDFLQLFNGCLPVEEIINSWYGRFKNSNYGAIVTFIGVVRDENKIDGLSFDIFEKIPTKSFIIYTTAFDQYTLKAFKLNSIDYLLKPISEEDLAKSIEKFKSFLPSEETHNALEMKSLIKEEQPKLSRILVKIGYNLKVIKTEEICCFYSENKIVYAQTLERSFPTDFTLDELEEVLDEKTFFRVNRQFIISSDCIKNIHTSPNYKVELQAQPAEEITVSRERVKDFKDWLVK